MAMVLPSEGFRIRLAMIGGEYCDRKYYGATTIVSLVCEHGTKLSEINNPLQNHNAVFTHHDATFFGVNGVTLNGVWF